MHDRSTIIKAQQMDLIQTLKLVYQTVHPHHSLPSATGSHLNACGKTKTVLPVIYPNKRVYHYVFQFFILQPTSPGTSMHNMRLRTITRRYYHTRCLKSPPCLPNPPNLNYVGTTIYFLPHNHFLLPILIPCGQIQILINLNVDTRHTQHPTIVSFSLLTSRH